MSNKRMMVSVCLSLILSVTTYSASAARYNSAGEMEGGPSYEDMKALLSRLQREINQENHREFATACREMGGIPISSDTGAGHTLCFDRTMFITNN